MTIIIIYDCMVGVGTTTTTTTYCVAFDKFEGTPKRVVSERSEERLTESRSRSLDWLGGLNDV